MAAGVRGLSGPVGLAGFPQPQPTRRLLSRLRRPLRSASHDHLQHPRRVRDARRGRPLDGPAQRWQIVGLRRAVRVQRPPLGSAHSRLSRRVFRRRLPRPCLLRPVRPSGHARQERRRRRHGQFGDGYRLRIVPAPDRQKPVGRRASRCLGAAEVSGRQGGRQGRGPAVDAARARPFPRARQDQEDHRQYGGLRLAEARPPAAGGPPLGVRGVPDPRRLRRYQVQAEHQGVRRLEASASRTTASRMST